MLYTLYLTLYAGHFSLDTLNFIPYIVYSALFTVHLFMCTYQFKPYTAD